MPGARCIGEVASRERVREDASRQGVGRLRGPVERRDRSAPDRDSIAAAEAELRQHSGRREPRRQHRGEEQAPTHH